MRCTLVVPAWDVRDIYPAGTAQSQVSFQHPDGILSVAAWLEREGHDVRVLDGAFWSHAALLDEVVRSRPDWVGIYANTPLWRRACRTATDLRARLPDVFLSAGGPAPIAWRGRCLDECPALDAVDTGEGELTTAELLQRLAAGEALHGLEGVCFRDAEGRVHENPTRPVLRDLDRLPFPAVHLLDHRERYVSPPGTYRRTPIVNVHTSRGCVNDCTFCFQLGPNVDPKNNRRIRYRSPEHVVAEIEQRLREGYREIRFLDDMFIVDKKRVRRICALLRERRLDVTWFCSSRVDFVDPDILCTMREAGCWAILYGAESGVQKNLDTLRKRTTLDQIRQAVRWAKDAGIRVYTPFIFGIPGETFEDGLKTIDFAIELDPWIANFHTLTPLPGTDLYEQVAHLGTFVTDPEQATFQHAAFVPDSMTRDELMTLRRLAFRRFYGRPRYVLRRLRHTRSRADLRALAAGARSMRHLVLDRAALDPRRIGR